MSRTIVPSGSQARLVLIGTALKQSSDIPKYRPLSSQEHGIQVAARASLGVAAIRQILYADAERTTSNPESRHLSVRLDAERKLLLRNEPPELRTPSWRSPLSSRRSARSASPTNRRNAGSRFLPPACVACGCVTTWTMKKRLKALEAKSAQASPSRLRLGPSAVRIDNDIHEASGPRLYCFKRVVDAVERIRLCSQMRKIENTDASHVRH